MRVGDEGVRQDHQIHGRRCDSGMRLAAVRNPGPGAAQGLYEQVRQRFAAIYPGSTRPGRGTARTHGQRDTQQPTFAPSPNTTNTLTCTVTTPPTQLNGTNAQITESGLQANSPPYVCDLHIQLVGAASIRSASAVNPSTESIASRVRSSESGHRWL